MLLYESKQRARGYFYYAPLPTVKVVFGWRFYCKYIFSSPKAVPKTKPKYKAMAKLKEFCKMLFFRAEYFS